MGLSRLLICITKVTMDHPLGITYEDHVFPRWYLYSGATVTLAIFFIFWWSGFLFVLFMLIPEELNGTASLHRPAPVRMAWGFCRRVHIHTRGLGVLGWSCMLRRLTFFTGRTGHTASVLVSLPPCLSIKAQKCNLGLAAFKGNFLSQSLLSQMLIVKQWMITLSFVIFHGNAWHIIQEWWRRTAEGLEWGGRIFGKIQAGLSTF